MNCPNCGNPLVSKGKFCPYCGTAVSEDILVKIDSRQEIVDHAKIEQAKVEGIKTEAKEKTKRRRGLVIIIIVLIVALAGLAFMKLSYFFPEMDPLSPKSDSLDDSIEKMRLHDLENEIMEDIRNERYEQALVKAQALRYTIDYSMTEKREWDKKREDLIRTLETIIKQKNGH